VARIRTIKPEFPHSESMGRVSRESRLCFILLWTIADDAGRLRGNSRMLASLLFPYDDDAKNHVDKWLTQLASEGCIARYEVDGTSYVQIMNWSDHQKIDKPSPSKLPAFVEPSRKLANVLEASALDQEGKGREGNGEEGSATPQSVEPPTLTLTLNDSSEHPIYAAAIAEWQTTYPGVDVMQQLREMRVWCTANPTNRKTKRGISAFVVRWLAREQDKSGQRPARTFGAVAQASTPSHDPDSREAIEAEGIARGVGPWSEMDEQWHIYKARVRGHQRVSLIGIDDLAAMAAKRQGVH
jgi:hypothetical protein